MTIAFFIIGSPIKFNKNNIVRHDGSNEYYLLLKLLLKNKSVERIVLLSRSDWARIPQSMRDEFDPNKKIFDPYSEIEEIKNRKKPITVDEDRKWYTDFYNILSSKIPVPDFGISFPSYGGWGSNFLSGYMSKITDPNTPVKTLQSAVVYASDVIYYLNMTNMPWWILATDPRYIKPHIAPKDVYNIPKEVLGQHEFDTIWRTPEVFDRSCRTLVPKVVKSIYSGIEHMNLMNDGIIRHDETDRKYKFTIVSMQLTPSNSTSDNRFNILKEYILDRDADKSARIFGRWSDYFKNGYPQFKGYIATDDLDYTFSQTRYTLVLPTKAGWVTSKYAEMLQLGVIPFLHPDYDIQYNVVPKDHVLRIKDANDFYDKMQYYDNNPEERIKFVNDLQDSLILNSYTGKFMLDLFNSQLEKYNYPFRFDDSYESLFEKRKKVFFKRNEGFIE